MAYVSSRKLIWSWKVSLKLESSCFQRFQFKPLLKHISDSLPQNPPWNWTLSISLVHFCLSFNVTLMESFLDPEKHQFTLNRLSFSWKSSTLIRNDRTDLIHQAVQFWAFNQECPFWDCPIKSVLFESEGNGLAKPYLPIYRSIILLN